MAVSKVVSPLFLTETKILDDLSGNYCQADVSKTGYTPVGIISVDATGLASSNSIRLFYISSINAARVGFVSAPSSGTYVTAKILYQRN